MILGELNELGLPILCVDDMPLEPAVYELVNSFKNAYDLSRRIDNVRLFGTLVSNSVLTVSPDSLAIHFAAVNATPCLSVWGSFDPDSRIKYYTNQIGLAHPERCPNAFCYNYAEKLPADLCPEGANQKACACYGGITAGEIQQAVASLLHQNNAKTQIAA
jgi:ADP-heptose:LPS heptosyltransferase